MMEKYNPDAKCPKCGNDDISSRFIAAGERYKVDDKGRKGRSYAEEETIKRHCCNCHCEWEETPLDKEQP